MCSITTTNTHGVVPQAVVNCPAVQRQLLERSLREVDTALQSHEQPLAPDEDEGHGSDAQRTVASSEAAMQALPVSRHL